MRMPLLSFFATAILLAGPENGTPAGEQKSPRHSASPGQSYDESTDSTQHSTIVATGYDSGLWRLEYLQSTQQDHTGSTENAGDVLTASGRIDSTTNGTNTAGAIDGTLAKLINNDTIEFATTSVPVLNETNDLLPDGSDPLDTTLQAMSDWEYASSFAAENKPRWGTASGPSATSIIVGVVGILIVIGAYVSSGSRVNA